MVRATLLSALGLLAAGLVTGPANGASYSAALAAPTNGRIIARDISWACAGQSCQGVTNESRPEVLCQGLAKRAGRIERFTVAGRAISEAELASCNGVAKHSSNKALAAQ